MNYSSRCFFQIIFALLVVLAAQSASASALSIGSLSSLLPTYAISDGSSGIFHPTSDFTLDLSGATVPQYSSVIIDPGITLTVLTPSGGVFADLLSAQDIIVYGIINAGSGALSLTAGNQIVLGMGSEIIAGSLSLTSRQLTLDGRVVLTDAIHGTDPGLIPGGRIALVPEPGTFLLIFLPVLILLTLRRYPSMALLAQKPRRGCGQAEYVA